MQSNVELVYNEILELKKKGLVGEKISIDNMHYLRETTGFGLVHIVEAKKFYEAVERLEAIDNLEDMKKFIHELMKELYL